MKWILSFCLLTSSLLAQNYSEKEVWRNFQGILNGSTSSLKFMAKYGEFEQTAVDYQKLAKDAHLQELIKQQQSVLVETTEPMRKEEQIAFWINAYNFFTLVDMSNEYPVESMKDIGWKNTRHNVGGKEYSLDQIEHEILRKLDEPRLHFAINCASVGCPSLSKNYYKVSELNQQLAEAVKNALKNPLHLIVEKEGNVLTTKLFDWFGSDWGGYEGVLKFIAKYGPVAPESIGTFGYDWDVNNKLNYDLKYKELEKDYPHYNLKRK